MVEQNAMYNSYHSDTMVKVSAHCAEGKVFLSALNFIRSVMTDQLFAKELAAQILHWSGLPSGWRCLWDADWTIQQKICCEFGSCSQRKQTVMLVWDRPVNAGCMVYKFLTPLQKSSNYSNCIKWWHIIQSIVHLHNLRTHVIEHIKQHKFICEIYARLMEMDRWNKKFDKILGSHSLSMVCIFYLLY